MTEKTKMKVKYYSAWVWYYLTYVWAVFNTMMIIDMFGAGHFELMLVFNFILACVVSIQALFTKDKVKEEYLRNKT